MATNSILALYLRYLLLCTLLSLAMCLSLPFQATSKPRHTKYSSPTPPPSPAGGGGAAVETPAESEAPPPPSVSPGSGIGLYRVNAENGDTCILMKTDALIEIEFKSNIGDEKGDTYMPEDATIEGNCKYEDESSMTVAWKGYILVINFAKTPGGERWYITNMEVTVSTDLQQYHNIKTHGHSIKLYHDRMLAPTPVGKSYNCTELEVSLVPREGDDVPADLRGTLFLRALQIQPFMYKGRNFGPAYGCNTERGLRSETAPIAVGSTLAVAVLLTVGGYGLFRYFKVNSVHYNTME